MILNPNNFPSTAKKPQMNIIFSSNLGETHNLKFYYGTTINQILTQYLIKIGRTDLIDSESNKITFSFNAIQLKFGDKTKIENYFHKLQCPKIFVNIIDNSFLNKSHMNKSAKPILNINQTPIQRETVDPNPLQNFENNELKQKLSEEKLKNKKLNKEILILRQQMELLKFELQKMTRSNEKYKKMAINTKNEYLITSINPGEKIIAVNFVSMGTHDIGHYNLICKNNDLFIKLEERLYKDFPNFKNYSTIFKVNNKTIKRFKTMDENKIKNNDVISIFTFED